MTVYPLIFLAAPFHLILRTFVVLRQCSRATMKLTFVVLGEMSGQLLDAFCNVLNVLWYRHLV